MTQEKNENLSIKPDAHEAAMRLSGLILTLSGIYSTQLIFPDFDDLSMASALNFDAADMYSQVVGNPEMATLLLDFLEMNAIRPEQYTSAGNVSDWYTDFLRMYDRTSSHGFSLSAEDIQQIESTKSDMSELAELIQLVQTSGLEELGSEQLARLEELRTTIYSKVAETNKVTTPYLEEVIEQTTQQIQGIESAISLREQSVGALTLLSVMFALMFATSCIAIQKKLYLSNKIRRNTSPDSSNSAKASELEAEDRLRLEEVTEFENDLRESDVDTGLRQYNREG